MAHIPKNKDRYEVWSKILEKHEKRWAQEHTANLDALYSNHCQVERELRKGRISMDEFDELAARYEALRDAVEASQKI